MSFLPGSSSQPEFVTTACESIEAPHAEQLRVEPSETRPHHGHVCVVCIMSKVQSRMSKVECPKSKVSVQNRVLSTFDFRLWTLDSYLIRLVMNVHRLDTDAPWSSHAREVHTRAAEESSG